MVHRVMPVVSDPPINYSVGKKLPDGVGKNERNGAGGNYIRSKVANREVGQHQPAPSECIPSSNY